MSALPGRSSPACARRAARRCCCAWRPGAILRGPAEPGDVLAVDGRLERLGRYDEASSAAAGRSPPSSATAAAPTGRHRGGLPGALDAVRRRAEAGLARGLPEREAALAQGMVLGRDDRIAAGTREAFQASGLAHLLAVSGTERDAAGAARARRGRRWRRAVAIAAGGRPRPGRALRAADGRRAVDPARRGDGGGGPGGGAGGAAGEPLVRARPRRGGDPRRQPLRRRRRGLAALLRRGGRAAVARHAPAGGAAPGTRPRGGGGGGRADAGGHDRHGAASGRALRAGVARVAAREPRRRAGGRAGDVARHACGGRGTGSHRWPRHR